MGAKPALGWDEMERIAFCVACRAGDVAPRHMYCTDKEWQWHFHAAFVPHDSCSVRKTPRYLWEIGRHYSESSLTERVHPGLVARIARRHILDVKIRKVHTHARTHFRHLLHSVVVCVADSLVPVQGFLDELRVCPWP